MIIKIIKVRWITFFSIFVVQIATTIVCYISLDEMSIDFEHPYLQNRVHRINILKIDEPEENEQKNISSSFFSTTSIPYIPFLGKVSEIYIPGFSYSPSKICEHQGEIVELLIMVISAPGNFEARQAIRETWGNLSHSNVARKAFLICAAEPATESKLIGEINKYDDIIRCKNIDNYRNLTLKIISMLEWVNYHCPKAKFILKADDDTFINVKKLLEIIQMKKYTKKSIYGRLARFWSPARDPVWKWYVSFEEYSQWFYPDFTLGPTYMMTSDCVEILYNYSLKKKFMKQEDVFITGIVAGQVGIKRFHLDEFKILDPTSISPCELKDVATIHEASVRQKYSFYRTLIDDNVFCE